MTDNFGAWQLKPEHLDALYNRIAEKPFAEYLDYDLNFVKHFTGNIFDHHFICFSYGWKCVLNCCSQCCEWTTRWEVVRSEFVLGAHSRWSKGIWITTKNPAVSKHETYVLDRYRMTFPRFHQEFWKISCNNNYSMHNDLCIWKRYCAIYIFALNTVATLFPIFCSVSTTCKPSVQQPSLWKWHVI